MIDIGVTKLAIIGAIALVVIGPEKLPALAKTAGTLLGRARRYVADVKAEVDRSMALDELKKMRDSLEEAARNVESTIQTNASDLEKTWAQATHMTPLEKPEGLYASVPEYQHPHKKWRLKQAATPQWYKARTGIRTKALSGAARVARFRPRKPGQYP